MASPVAGVSSSKAYQELCALLDLDQVLVSRFEQILERNMIEAGGLRDCISRIFAQTNEFREFIEQSPTDGRSRYDIVKEKYKAETDDKIREVIELFQACQAPLIAQYINLPSAITEQADFGPLGNWPELSACATFLGEDEEKKS